MSSSVFIESSSQPAVDSTECTNASDSNLVVVYGKNGISFDDKGLENLIEEKKISSISVIRLTSPTPSMQNEEDEAEKLEEMLRRQEIGSDEDSVCSDDDDDSSSCDRNDTEGNADSSNDDGTMEEKKFNKDSDSELKVDNKTKQRKLRRRGRQPISVKQKKLQRRRKRDRPEIVGLRLEEFYPPEDANEIIKEALKIAGLEKKSQSDYDFQLFVIQNDHCYTPFTSPTQMKAKLAADKLEAEKNAANRKSSIPPTIGKKLFVRKKQLQMSQKSDMSIIKQSVSVNPLKDKFILVASKSKKDIKDRKVISEEDYIDNEDIHSSQEENVNEIGDEDESDFSGEDDSDETDNDRDSDLDFDVNNPKGRKRKTKLLKTLRRPLVVSKVISKPKRLYGQDETKEVSNTVLASSSQNATQKQKPFIKNSSDISRISVRSTPSKSLHTIGQTTILSPAIAALPPIPKKSENKALLSALGNSKLIQLPPKTYVVVKGSLESKSSTSQSTPQTHKEIIINKQAMISPKNKGFTDLKTLIDQNAIPTITKAPHSATITSVVTLTPSTSGSPTAKGFMPLETLAKNQLPAQISIQTHQSSSELEAEHDKQLDLINSIVQDEMQKSNEKADEKIVNLNKNIPELVKMLESTEKVLVSAKMQQSKVNDNVLNEMPLVSGSSVSNKCISDNQSILNQTVTSSSSSNNIVGGIDITSANLLATPEEDDTGDLPDDILQQVVELIKDDKTLQEAVEKQVFGTDVCGEENISGNAIDNQNPPPLVPIAQQSLRIQEKSPSTTKSIIEMSISNISTSLGSSSSIMTTADSAYKITTGNTTTTPSNQTSKSTALLRKEPIQIIRGNGRVITLPPIEAPTTRAKRRAQAQPISSSNTSYNPNAMLNESADGSLHSISSTSAASSSVATTQEKKLQDSNSRRRGSKENVASANQKTTTARKTTAKKGGSKSNSNKSYNEAEATDSEADDDDDPNKLWCICRQPHNNRFMICCDVCEDWFHGTCVSITKAMGLEMEQKGIDWTCPKCLKKQEEKKQPKITEMLIKKPATTSAGQLASTPINNDNSVKISAVLSSPTTTISLAENSATKPIEHPSVSSKSESTINAEPSAPLKLQCGQIINLRDCNTSITKRATIIQTSTNNTSCITAGQKKLFVTSGQANLKMSSQPGTPIRTITVVKQISTQPQHHQQHHNIKIIKTLSPITTTTTYNAATTATEIVSNSSSTTTTAPNSTKSTTLCIVCKKYARSNSIYCSDDCIRKHAQNALNSLTTKSQADNSVPISSINKGSIEEKTKKKSKGLFEDLLSAADRKPKLERVNVYERKSGRIITGNNAPTTANLKKWLQDNPTFEVIQPGSVQALDLEKKQKIRSQHSSSPSILKSASSPPPLKMFSSTSNNTLPKTESNTVNSQNPMKSNRIVAEHIKSSSISTSARPSTPKQLQKYPQQVGIKPDKVPKPADDSKALATKRQATTESSNKTSNFDGEPIRLVVRRTLKEQLLLRIKEEISSTSNESEEMGCESAKLNSNIPKLSEEEVEEFVKATELEMYNFFSRDTGSKYKAKYRSLIFNIKDRKNHTLFAKICGKLIEPKQLVRMSPEEMASQELAQWREQEAKHQLEMIKKSELDLLSCANNYVLKTHKGEEVIEGKSSEYAKVDITIPVEDVVSALNKSDLPDNAKAVTVRKETQIYMSDVDSVLSSNSCLPSDSNITQDADRMKVSCSNVKDKDREKDKEKESSKNRDRERDRDKHHKSKDRHHDKSRSRKRSRSRSRSRSRDKGEKRHKSYYKEEKRDRDDRTRDKERAKERSEREHLIEGNEKKSETRKNVATHLKQITKKHTEQQKVTNNPLETYNLIDKILESTKTVEEAANLVSEKDKEKGNENIQRTTVAPATTQTATSTVSSCSSSSETAVVIDIPANISSAESDQEPTSTVSIPTPPHDPYAKYMSCLSPSLAFSGNIQDSKSSIWTGNINMVDVTSFQLTIQPIIGNSSNLAKLMPRELDVVGRIGPDTVWDYIYKIKKSPNKEIVVIRLIPANESETAAYKVLYEYLDNRNRLGVIKSTSPQIKDFYIYPLGAGKNVPRQLEPAEPVEFYDDQYRPDVLIGIIIRVVGNKRPILLQTSTGASSVSSGLNKHQSRTNDVKNFTPPGSPKTKKNRQSNSAKKAGEIDIDAIIKAPIVAKAQKSTIPPSLPKLNDNDADEPYSPGGSSDDDLPLLPLKTPGSADHMQAAEDDLKRKMEEINRQIAAQEMEIAGLLTGEPSTFGSSAASTSNVLANISIPSNLSQILASIKTTGKDNQPVAPPPPPLIGSLLKPSTSSTQSADKYNSIDNMGSKSTNTDSNVNTTSLLAKLSEAELLSMVPDDIVITPKNPTRNEEPPPPGV